MPEFKKNNRFTSSARRPFQNRDSRQGGFNQKELYDAECNGCHNRCQVPFRPNGKKPVYCSDCFKRDDDRGAAPRFEKRDFNSSSSYGNAPRNTNSTYSSSPRTSSAPAASQAPDPRIDDIKRELKTMSAA